MQQAGRIPRLGTLVFLAAAVAVGCSDDSQDEEVLAPPGTPVQVTTDTVTVHHLEPALSPDGTMIAFSTDWWAQQDLEDKTARDIAVIDVPVDGPYPVTPDLLDIGNVRRVEIQAVPSLSGEQGFDGNESNKAQPAWHPDGQRLVWVMENANNRDRLYIANLDLSSSPVQVNNLQLIAIPPAPEYFLRSPAFSPDGQWLAFSRFFFKPGSPNTNPPIPDVSEPQAIYAMNMTTLEVFQVTPGSSHEDSPTWSPDGRAIAFESNRDGLTEIYTITFDPDNPGTMPLTSSLRRLTFTSTDPSDPIPVTSFDPTWSPDGSSIVFVSTRRAPATSFRDRNLWIMGADGSDQRILFFSRTDDHFPSFHPSNPEMLVFSTMSNRFDTFDGQKTDLYLLENF